MREIWQELKVSTVPSAERRASVEIRVSEDERDVLNGTLPILQKLVFAAAAGHVKYRKGRAEKPSRGVIVGCPGEHPAQRNRWSGKYK